MFRLFSLQVRGQRRECTRGWADPFRRLAAAEPEDEEEGEEGEEEEGGGEADDPEASCAQVQAGRAVAAGGGEAGRGGIGLAAEDEGAGGAVGGGEAWKSKEEGEERMGEEEGTGEEK